MDWQPIGTAPKDRWLLIFSDYDGCHVACWDPSYGGVWRDNETDQCGDLVPIEKATHWMSLPDNPAK